MNNSPDLQNRFSPSWKTLFFIFLSLLATRAIFYSLSDGFSLTRIVNTFQEEAIKTPTENEKLLLQNICSSPFIYLNKGSQSYAFLSQDGQYVLKLFKCYHLKPVKWLEDLPLPSFLDSPRNSALERRKKKRELTFSSYNIAYNMLKDECGLIYLQLTPSPSLQQEITITDKIGRTYTINLGTYGFMIQKKVDLIFPKLEFWISHHKEKEAKAFLASLVDLIVTRCQKGIQDQDPDLHKNAGCIGTRAVFLDVGAFHLNDEAKKREACLQDIKKVTQKLSTWLEKRSPELHSYLQSYIENATL
jgi:hypothetical protein